MHTSHVEARALTIAEFCASYRVSRSTFYNLSKAGDAPATMNIGRRVLIPVASAEAWARKMTEATA